MVKFWMSLVGILTVQGLVGSCFADDRSVYDRMAKASSCLSLSKQAGFIAELEADPSLTSLSDSVGTLLHEAIRLRRIWAIRPLMEHGANCDILHDSIFWMSPLHQAAYGNETEMLDIFLTEYHAKVDSLGTAPEGMRPQSEPHKFQSALGAAARGGAAEAVQLLLKRGAKLDPFPPEKSYSALHHAMRGDWEYRIENWTRHKAQYDRVLDKEILALMTSPDAGPSPTVGNTTVIQLLIDAGADLKGVNCEGDQPLHIAVGRLQLETIQFLIDNHKDQIDLNALGRFGCSPLNIALNHRLRPHEDPARYQAVIDLLRKHGAKNMGLGIPVRPPEADPKK